MNRSARQITTLYLVMFALIFNAVTSSVAYASGQKGVLLCTSQGYKWVKLDSDTDSSQQVQPHCKICLFPSNDNSSDDFRSEHGRSPLLSDTKRQTPAPFYSHFKTRFAHLVAQSRAPPLITLSIF